MIVALIVLVCPVLLVDGFLPGLISPYNSIYLIFNFFFFNQGFNAREVISEVYTSFVLQCTVSAR